MRNLPTPASARCRAEASKSNSSCCHPFWFCGPAVSDAEIGVELVHIGRQLRIGETVDDLAVLDDVVAIGNGGGEAEILFDQEDGETLVLEPCDGVADLLDDDRRQTFGRLV